MTAVVELGSLVASGRLATVRRGSLGGRAVAVKRARAGVPGAAAALRREARILRAASHPALVLVLDVVDDAHEPTIVLGWADGGSLEDLLADGPLGTDDLLHLLRPVAEALEALHRAGVAHLDVSTRNVLLAAAGPVLIDPAPPGAGTPGFADPAVAAGAMASARSDVFGLAACAHVALTGRHPRVVGGVAPGSVLPPAVTAALAAGLDPEPRCRPPSPVAFLDQLEAALTSSPGATPPSRRRPPGRPVVRHRDAVTTPARTWPFERWQEEAEADAARRGAAGAVTAPPPSRRRRRRLVTALVVVSTCAAGGAAWMASTAGPGRHPVRSSVPDDTRRPHGARPPSTTTLGSKP